MKKKLTVLALTMGLVLSLVGCGKEDSEKEESGKNDGGSIEVSDEPVSYDDITFEGRDTYELWCSCGEKVLVTVYVPVGCEVESTTTEKLDAGENLDVVWFGSTMECSSGEAFGLFSIRSSTSDMISYYLEEGVGRYDSHTYNVTEMEPVAGGQECFLLEEIWVNEEDPEYSGHQFHIIMPYVDCDGTTQYCDIKFENPDYTEYWTLDKFQHYAYEILGF